MQKDTLVFVAVPFCFVCVCVGGGGFCVLLNFFCLSGLVVFVFFPLVVLFCLPVFESKSKKESIKMKGRKVGMIWEKVGGRKSCPKSCTRTVSTLLERLLLFILK